MQRYRTTYGIAGYEYEDNFLINQHIDPRGIGFPDGNYQEKRLAGFNQRAGHLIYTSIVVDLIDNENQRFTRGHNGNVAYPQDQVSGFTIQQVEQGLRGAASWNAWRNNMINRHANPIEGFVNELFANWY